MADTLIHRGPDDSGAFPIVSAQWCVNLAMRRLSIIDRAGGAQPMHAGKIDLVFNGEIYNYRGLRDTLKGVPFKTQSDTEVVGRLWEQQGPVCVNQLEGMFGIAIWDRCTKALYLVRDRMGKKPLYYAWDEGQNVLVFGSEIKALLAHPHISREVNPEALFHYLSLQYCPEPATAYNGIMCVPPGGMVTYKPNEGKLEVSQWWTLKPWTQGFEIGERNNALCDIVRGEVRQAVLSRLESEVPLGVYLSGGIDSAIVTAVVREGCKELHTFSMGFKEDAFNELPLARQTAKHFGTIHHEALVELPQLPDMVERISYQYDQPFGDCSAIPTMLLAEESKKYITVALTGDGGDEAFGGYERYFCDRSKGIMGYIPYLTVIPCPVRDKMLDGGFKKSLQGTHTTGWMLQQAMSYPGQDLVNQMGWLDTKTYLPNDIIVKMERASMAASVEARCPFLDHRVFELAFAIPGNLKVEGNVGKLILKDAFKDLLPLSVLLRPKRGFGVPMDAWFRSEVGRQMLMAMVTDTAWPWGILNGGSVASMIEAHLKGSNYGHPLWMIYMLHQWLKRNF